MRWAELEWVGITVGDWLTALLIAATFILLFSVVHRRAVAHLHHRSDNDDTRIYHFFATVLSRTPFLFLTLLSIYIGTQFIELPGKPARILDRVMVAALLIQAALWGSRGITWWLTRTLNEKRSTDTASLTTIAIIGFIARVLLWSLILLMILDNFGVNITALIASLGVGGIAVALATQNILSDIFASLAITLDKPFVVGDFIVVDTLMGTVEFIGIKTTRIRSLEGEQIIFSNAELLKSRIQNYKRMVERRVEFGFNVQYATAPDNVERVPGIVRRIIEAQPKTRFDRAHLKNIGEYALHFEVVYFVLDADYNVYMNIQQAINVALLRELPKNGAEFPYPVRHLYLHDGVDDKPAKSPARSRSRSTRSSGETGSSRLHK
jgi:small-conductance mechanosensitive channel